MSPKSPETDLRTIWCRQPINTTPISPEQFRKNAVTFQRTIRFRNAGEYLGAIIVILGYGYYIVHFQSLSLRIGSALIIAATLFVMYHLHRYGSAQSVPAESSAEDCLVFHRKQLERNRDLLRGVWRWYLAPFVPGLMVFFLGRALELPTGNRTPIAIAITVCVMVFVGIGVLNHWGARRLQRMIETLNADSQ